MSSSPPTRNATLVEKKRKFSLFRSRQPEPVVAVIPVVDPQQQDDRPSLHTPAMPVSSSSATLSTSVPIADPTISHSHDTRFRDPTPSSDQVVGNMPSSSGTHNDGLPTYASATNLSEPVTYGFIRCSPFAMVLSPDGAGVESHGLYHISIGVNIWMPSMTVTTVRRGSKEDGPVVASVE